MVGLYRTNIESIQGLTEAEAREKLRVEGYNEIPSAKRRSIFAIALEIVTEPMFLLLVACGFIYLFLGDLQEACMLLGFVFVVMGITLYQERKTERALEALRDLSSPRAMVIREGKQQRIAGREVVRGDFIMLAEGDRIPADATLLFGSNFQVDESLLTGESVPVRKLADPAKNSMDKPGGDDLPSVYSGTMVVQGQGIAKVLAVGMHTELGRIGKSLQTLESEDTLLQKEIGILVRNLAIAGMILCIFVVVIYSLNNGDWLRGFLAGLTLAMAVLPEEFPVVLTIFLALGAWRIAQKNVLTRRVPAVENLGSATVLCVDKTGTLTMNQMQVQKIFSKNKFMECDCSKPEHHLPEDFHELIEYAILASQSSPFDPMEKAIHKVGAECLKDTEHLHNDWNLVQEYPLSKQLLALSHVWESPDGQNYEIASKGAPEAIAELCHLNTKELQDLEKNILEMAGAGLRVLGVAKADFRKIELPDQQHEFNFKFLGLIGLADPIRAAVPAAVKECYTAGIRVVMITGDYPVTAQNIGRQIGLAFPEKYITGKEIGEMDFNKLREQVKTVNIFARVVPEQKLRLVEALKANGEIVAMTGDGVNDSPALKAADIGIAMGGRGTDVARESAALVLLDDDFSSIVQAVRLGRRIYDNLKKAMAYVIAVHVPIAGMSLLPILLKWPLVLLPVHIVFLELIIDPACSVVFEAENEEVGVMNRPPRDPSKPLFDLRIIGISLLQGLSVLLIVFAVFGISFNLGHNEDQARALTFTTMIIANLSLIFTNRCWSRTIFQTMFIPNKALWLVTLGATSFLFMALYVPFLKGLFHFSTLHFHDFLICAIVGLFSITWFELLKFFKFQIKHNI